MIEKPLVYLLWDHEESGPENLRATLHKENVCNLVPEIREGLYLRYPNLLPKLSQLLEEKGNCVGTYNLIDGWGGLHLQIVKLD